MLVSACLIGRRCTHRADDNLHEVVHRLVDEGRAIPVCPEVEGGLPTPRPPAELEPGVAAEDVLDGRGAVRTRDGDEVTGAYVRGARVAVERAAATGARVAILKARSPSCGSGQVYDGTFSKRLRPGDGITAAALRRAGVEVHSEEDLAGS